MSKLKPVHTIGALLNRAQPLQHPPGVIFIRLLQQVLIKQSRLARSTFLLHRLLRRLSTVFLNVNAGYCSVFDAICERFRHEGLPLPFSFVANCTAIGINRERSASKLLKAKIVFVVVKYLLSAIVRSGRVALWPLTLWVRSV